MNFSARTPPQTVGAIELTAAQLAPEDLVYIVNDGPQVTVTSLDQLAIFFQNYTVLTAVGGFLVASGLGLTLWPTSSSGLPAGSLWVEVSGSSGFVVAVPVGHFVPGPPAFLGQITGTLLLAEGVAGMPLSDPRSHNQLWLNGGFVCVSAG